MREIITKVYQYDELSEKAKEKARDWYLQGAFDYDWYEHIYEDANNVGLKITSFDLGGRQDIEGKFMGNALECAENIKKEHGKDCDSYKIAANYLFDRDKLAVDDDGDFADEDEADKLANEFLHEILEEYLSILRKEMEYIESKEHVEEMIQANEYEFTEDGKRYRYVSKNNRQ